MINKLLEKVWLYINGNCTLQYLETWLVSNLQNILDSGDAKAIEIANQLDADLVELGEGLLDEEALRNNLPWFDSLNDTYSLDTSQASTSSITVKTEAGVHPAAVSDYHLDPVSV